MPGALHACDAVVPADVVPSPQSHVVPAGSTPESSGPSVSSRLPAAEKSAGRPATASAGPAAAAVGATRSRNTWTVTGTEGFPGSVYPPPPASGSWARSKTRSETLRTPSGPSGSVTGSAAVNGCGHSCSSVASVPHSNGRSPWRTCTLPTPEPPGSAAETVSTRARAGV